MEGIVNELCHRIGGEYTCAICDHSTTFLCSIHQVNKCAVSSCLVCNLAELAVVTLKYTAKNRIAPLIPCDQLSQYSMSTT